VLAFALVCCAAQAGEIRGAAVAGSTLYTWGDELAAWRLPSLERKVIVSGRTFEAGGCTAGDKFVLQERGKAILLDAATRREQVFETETRFASCLPFTLAGRKGIVITHLDAQLRFYLLPGMEMKELYSIYTASRQGGLLAHDVDGDGLDDLFFGNYWVRNPGALDVAWRLFAINLWHDTPEAALAALALDRGDLIWAESSARQARIARFEKPGDPKQLWLERRLPPLDYPRAVLATQGGIFIGHGGGVELLLRSGGRQTVMEGSPCVALAESEGTVYAVSPGGVRAVYPRK
jgi:hypothetical protein